MLKVSEAHKRIIESKIEEIVNHGYSKILIYPFGNLGKYAKEVLQKYKDIIIFQGDNLCSGGDVLSKQEVIDLINRTTDIYVLFATTKSSFFSDLNLDNYLEKKERFLFLMSKRAEIQIDSILNKQQRSIEQIKIYDLSEYYKIKEISLHRDDYFAGHIGTDGLIDMIPDNIDREINLLKDERNIDFIDIKFKEIGGVICRNPGNHVIPGYDRVLQRGLDYYRQILEKFNDERVVLIESLQKHILKYEEAAKNIHTSNCERIAKACRWISKNAPRTLFEAIQLLIFLHEAVVDEAGCGSISFGRVDQYLYSFYKGDIDNNRITNDEAQEMIDAFWKKISENEMSWQNVTVGGRIQTGEDGCNELTMMALEATKRLHKDQPQLSLRDSGMMPKEIWSKAMDVIATGGGMPSIFCDDVAIAAKEHVGVEHDDAVDYGVMGCVELCIGGKEYSHTEGMRVNLAKLLENLLMKLDDLGEIALNTFDDFFDLYLAELKSCLLRLCEFIDIAGDNYSKHWPVPFLSLFMDRCIESKKDVTAEGTIYNFSTICPVGFASAVDSLEAIRECIYERDELDLSMLIKQLKENHSNSKIQHMLLNCEKYGNDLQRPDEIAKRLTDCIQNVVDEYRGKYRKGRIQLGYYTSYFHSDFGKLTGATPDGRKSGEPLSPSYSSMSGMDHKGPLALMNSATKMDMKGFANGMALDVRFAKRFLQNTENQSKLISAIKGYFKKGGMEIQINCFDNEELIDAQLHPENHRNLVVRVAGFSAYFIYLDRELQNEIIKRSANEVF